MKYKIKDRWTFDVMYECELPNDTDGWKESDQLGFAIKQAIKKGASLNGGSLDGASLNGAKGIVDAGHRSDGYRFVATVIDNVLMISAGCRWFTPEQAREHWTRTRANTQLGNESLAMVDYLERLARIRGLLA